MRTVTCLERLTLPPASSVDPASLGPARPEGL